MASLALGDGDAVTGDGETPWHRLPGMVNLLALWTGGTGDSEHSLPAWHPAMHVYPTPCHSASCMQSY